MATSPVDHQKYAADLVVDRGGRTFEGTRELASSYHCWDEPILAPADGVVVAVENDHQDWPVGQRDHANPAGNLVIIDIGDGLYVMMAHLRMGSVTMAEGERVVVGDVVGRCGNSGNTSEPHLHMQVQDSPVFNFEDRIETFPFRFTNTIHIRGGTEYPEQQDQFRRNDLVRTKKRGAGRCRAAGTGPGTAAYGEWHDRGRAQSVDHDVKACKA